MRNNSGFSAFEVAVAIAIVAVIAAITMPNYLKWLRAYRLRGATSNLVADLEMAKIRAIRENASVVVKFHTTRYEVYVDNNPNDGAWQAGDELRLRNRNLPAGISINPTAFTDNQTRFNGRGIPPEIINAETITLTNSIKTKQISINRLGYTNVN
jgi:prepilin-type N-terminal cleavage/methylation domain-containing protein